MVETGQYLPAKLLFETLTELDYHLVPEKSARITVRLQPRASRDEVLGWQDVPGETGSSNEALELRVRVKAVPVDGAANAALIQLLSKQLRLSKSNISLVAGAASRNKIVEILDLSPGEIKNRLSCSLVDPTR